MRVTVSAALEAREPSFCVATMRAAARLTPTVAPDYSNLAGFTKPGRRIVR